MGIETLQANAIDVRCTAETASLLYLNPPYDWEAGSSNNQRLESVFLEHTYRWLKPGGVLIFVIPQLRLAKCARLLSEHFQDLRVCRLTEPACLEYKQIVVLGTRRKRHTTLTDSALVEKVRWLEGLATKPNLDPLGEDPEIRYDVPCSGPLVLTHVGIPLDEVEDLLGVGALVLRHALLGDRLHATGGECSVERLVPRLPKFALTGALGQRLHPGCVGRGALLPLHLVRQRTGSDSVRHA